MCLCKDTNFKANHNGGPFMNSFGLVVCAYAKILILKQITTCFPIKTLVVSCMCLCKDTNFKANHNQGEPLGKRGGVVCAYAKILILKQITTVSSISQPSSGCMCLCKDTNFKANHNLSLCIIGWQLVVCAYAKILILKQITTVCFRNF